MQLIDDKNTDDRFEAALLVSRRARNLVDGANPLTTKTKSNVVSQAIKEYNLGLLKKKQD